MRTRLLAACLALTAAALAPAAAHAGPPWISVELPANPHDPATRGALAVVHLYHHEVSTPWPLDAQAIGLVDGQRRTVRLEAKPGSAAGVMVVRGTLPRGEGWVLVLTMQAGPTARASALVALDRRGDVASLRVPVDTIENGRWVVPREARGAEVDAMLRVAAGGARMADAPASSPVRRGGLALAGVGLALLAPFGLRRRA